MFSERKADRNSYFNVNVNSERTETEKDSSAFGTRENVVTMSIDP